MREKPITLVLSLYNVEKILSECLNSIIAQTYQTLEVVWVNDDSPDKGRLRIGKYCTLKGVCTQKTKELVAREIVI